MKNRAKVRFSAGQTASVQFAVKVVVRRGAGSHFKGLKKHFKERLQEAFPAMVFDTAIGRTVKFPDATVARKPITTFAPTSEAAEAYRRVARELVKRGSAA